MDVTWPCSEAGEKAVAHCAKGGKGPIHPGNADLSLSRPFHVRPGQVPHQGGGPEGEAVRSATPSSACKRACSNAGSAHEAASRRSTRKSRRSSPRPPNSLREPGARSVRALDRRLRRNRGLEAGVSAPLSQTRVRDMPIEILMPALSPTMDRGHAWPSGTSKEGDQVASGDVIAEIETDKATMEVEAVDEGTVLAKSWSPRAPRACRSISPDRHPAGATAKTASALDERQGCRGASPKPMQPHRCDPGSAASRRRLPAPSPHAQGSAPQAEPDMGRRQLVSPRPCARRCATPWPKRCGATNAVFLMGEEVAEYQGRL